MPAIPEGFTTVTPSLVVKDCVRAIELYKKAFGAEEMHCMKMPGGDKVMHACLKIGNAMFFMCDEIPGMCAATQNASYYLYVPDADAAYAKAIKAGMTEKWAIADKFWGDRNGVVADEFGVMWNIASHVRDVSEDDLKKGAQEMAASMGSKAA